MLQHKFPYISGRPMLMAKLYQKGCTARYMEFLIDSGADYTLISKSNAFLLGLEYKSIKKPEMKVEVANLTFIKTKKVRLIITIENQDFSLPVLIADQEVENLLGRKGIFDHFDILFQESKQQVIFKSIA